MAAIAKALDIPVLASGGALDYVTREDLPDFKTAVGMYGGWADRLAAPSRLIIHYSSSHLLPFIDAVICCSLALLKY
jgi:hypothetical protein